MVNKENLTARSLDSFMEEVRSQDGRVEELAGALLERGFRAVLEDMFELSGQQRARLDAVLTKEFETICRDACLIALKTNGSITYSIREVDDGDEPQAMRADVECEGDLDEMHCGVTFEC
ncbi:MAG: hypothetical protein M3401_06470 [Actinomycetota bacterium]|nr:hypothetical protein [Actinomycetota bacterium]